MQRITVRDIAEMKTKGEKIPMVTTYDYPTARLAEAADIPVLLVGDSLGMVVLGYDSTIPVTMADMLHHVKAVARGAKKALIVADLPFMSYQVDAAQAMTNAGRMVQEGGAHAVKLEGGECVAETVRRVVACGIPVMGHIGLTPQSVNAIGGYRVQGRGLQEAAQLLRDARALQAAGAFALVLELVPAPLAGLVSRKLSIPTIGIGAGPECDGQVQVLHDMLGLYTDFVPKHAKQYAHLAQDAQAGLSAYAKEVREGAFPTEKESFSMGEAVLRELESL
ncbi:MAG: 3-methyl-2-oxobutanoate hydroxymethyltransferase [Dehalococcoidia bacterium]|nr:3-methyl-2-oxobutanoate hydroxymethyltransferase [Dehalococcoidia bacterium]MSQ17731.1 3-methyl-2-oxobutanoate hydroxymethyltransferase [Dehalococcoidia bacterium]